LEAGEPGAVEPVSVREGERLLSDGGMISMIPVKIARKEWAGIVRAVALGHNMHTCEEIKTVKDIL